MTAAHSSAHTAVAGGFIWPRLEATMGGTKNKTKVSGPATNGAVTGHALLDHARYISSKHSACSKAIAMRTDPRRKRAVPGSRGAPTRLEETKMFTRFLSCRSYVCVGSHCQIVLPYSESKFGARSPCVRRRREFACAGVK
jgi:hypothetical protein